MKNIIIVAPEFPPNNLVGVHRNRFLAAHLEEFGYKPTVLTVKSKFYKEKLDSELEHLVPKNINIIKTNAFKANKIIGDTSIRCFFQHWKTLRKLAKQKKIDIIFISLFPAYSTLLGRLMYEEFKIPYCIDYQDPWVAQSKFKHRLLSKAWISDKLARILEPIATKKISLLMSVSQSYLTGVLKRNPKLKKIKTVIAPIGFEPNDYLLKEKKEILKNKYFTFTYAGAALPKSYPVLNAFFTAVEKYNDEKENKKVKIKFIGTGFNTNDEKSFNIKPHAKNHNLYESTVTEQPARIPYCDCLHMLESSDCILIIGSTEKHYTASKIFPAVFSKKPVLAILHEQSSAAKMLKESNAGVVITFKDKKDLEHKINQIKIAIEKITSENYNLKKVNYDYFNAFTAKSCAHKLSKALENITLK